MERRTLLTVALGVSAALIASGRLGAKDGTGGERYVQYVRECVDLLMAHGTDRYGDVRTPILVSILDVESRVCPAAPKALDEAWRVVRRGRRNPAGANLLTDQPLLKTMRSLSAATGDEKYARFAKAYVDYYVKNLVDEKGFFWWGWHRHYDVYKDKMDGHAGNHHEIHAITGIDWPLLWEVSPAAVRKEIEAIWRWHVIDKKTGEINRHGDGRAGCDFSMSAGSYIEAFVFLYGAAKEKVWLDRAKLIADYYWTRRNPATNLFADRPNAGKNRFDGSCFVTSITGPYCHALLKAYERSGQAVFRDHATAYLKAYAEHGFDEKSGRFWGALKLDGTPIPGPRVPRGYAQYEPRGHLDLWEPYVAGYQYAIYTAQAYAYAAQLTQDEALLTAARRFAAWIQRSPPGTVETADTWYKAYCEGPGRQGTCAGKYGRTVSFFLHMYVLTKEAKYLESARRTAETAVRKLHHKGLFRGHPAKPYYEAIDGVGYLLYAFLQLGHVLKNPDSVPDRQKTAIGLDNW